jgi:hypothetical protein
LRFGGGAALLPRALVVNDDVELVEAKMRGVAI